MNVVPWPKIKGERVTTNGIMEDALGLTGLIAGWCHEGFYVSSRPGAPTSQQIRDQVAKIHWHRVLYVKNHFDIKAVGYAVICDQFVHFVTERRFERLMQACFRTVPDEKYLHEIDLARRSVKGARSNASGHL